MKYFYILLTLFLFLGSSANAQLTGFTPSTGTYGQALTTTITGNGIFIQSSSPSGNLFSIKLIKGVDQLVLFDYPNFWNYWGLVNVIDPNTVTADFIVPLGTVPGVYDLEVITGNIFDPWCN